MENNDIKRELEKIKDVLMVVDEHFHFEARMNAALHMSPAVRPAPLAAAVSTALGSLDALIKALNDDNK